MCLCMKMLGMKCEAKKNLLTIGEWRIDGEKENSLIHRVAHATCFDFLGCCTSTW